MADYDYNVSSVHGIRAFLWAALAANGVVDKTKYKGLIPIVSVQETGELIKEIETLGNPAYMIYNWTTEDSGDDWWLETDQIVFLIYSPDRNEIRRIVNFMNNVFRRRDQSADAVNKYIDSKNSPQLSHFDYKSISVQTSGAPLPVEAEGGRSEAMVSLLVTYTQDEVLESDTENFEDLAF